MMSVSMKTRWRIPNLTNRKEDNMTFFTGSKSEDAFLAIYSHSYQGDQNLMSKCKCGTKCGVDNSYQQFIRKAWDWDEAQKGYFDLFNACTKSYSEAQFQTKLDHLAPTDKYLYDF